MTRQPGGPAARRRLLRPRGLRRRLVIAFVLMAAVSAGTLAVASYLLVRQARLQGSLTASEVHQAICYRPITRWRRRSPSCSTPASSVETPP